MLETLHYDLSNDADIVKMSNPVGTNRLKENLKNDHNIHFTIMDLVTIFADEAEKVCSNKRVANLIALEALNDYVKGHVNNVKIAS
jgi:hypothetical protein